MQINEVLADPTFGPDSTHEFIELHNKSSLECSQNLVLCREENCDTIETLASYYPFSPSYILWRPSYSLPNSRDFSLTLSTPDKHSINLSLLDSVVIPKSKPGRSWNRTATNTWEESCCQDSLGHWVTPGYGDTLQYPIPNIYFEDFTFNEDTWNITLNRPAPLILKLYNWQDSCTFTRTLSENTAFQLEGSKNSAYYALQIKDPHFPPDNDLRISSFSPPWGLKISEINASSHNGYPEYLEIQNISQDTLDLQKIEVHSNNKVFAPLDSQDIQLPPGKSCILSDRLEELEAKTGSIRICRIAMQASFSLPDDSLNLSLYYSSNLLLDSTVWQPPPENNKLKGSYIRTEDGWIMAQKNTPGYCSSNFGFQIELCSPYNIERCSWIANIFWPWNTGNYRLFKATGEIIQNHELNPGDNLIHLNSPIPPGYYLLEMLSDSAHIPLKSVVVSP